MRSLLLAAALGLTLMAQAPASPVRILDTAALDLDWKAELFITPEGRILAFAGAGADPSQPSIGLWDGPAGLLLRATLPPWEPTQDAGSGLVTCGGCGGPFGPIVELNHRPPGWDPLARAFDLPRLPEAPQARVTDQGDLQEGGPALPPLAQVTVEGLDALRVTRPEGTQETFRHPLADLPELGSLSPLQRSMARLTGFRNVLVSRTGDWVAATWIDGKRNLPGRALPWVPKGPLRWLLFLSGQAEPVVDLPLAALTGGTPDRVSLSLSPQGTRILLEGAGRVVVLSPEDGGILLNRPGSIVHLTSGSDELVLAQPGEGLSLARFDLREGRRTGALSLPASLDAPPALGPGSPEVPEGQGPRALTAPLAFSPDGRWVVTAQARRGGSGWDALVLWEFQAP